MLREVEQKRHDLADLLNVELVFQKVVDALDERLLLLNDRIAHLLKRQQHHVVALGQKVVYVVQKLMHHLLAEFRPNLGVAPEDQQEHDVVELVEHHKAEQVLVLWNVEQQSDDVLEEGAHVDTPTFR